MGSLCSSPTPMVSEVNRAKRVDFARMCLDTNESFENMVFTDECTVRMESHGRIAFVKRQPNGKRGPRPTVASPKHPYSVHLWGGISNRGPTPVVMFTQNMDRHLFIEILRSAYAPWAQGTWPEGCRLQQDNDPKHTSKDAKAYIETAQLNWWPTPPSSPDLNPIECTWHNLKHFLRTEWHPTTTQALQDGINWWWNNRLTPELCQRYIGHIRKVLPKVIELEGRATGH